ncbi:unnamed protein product, partial [Laminaria digitata]
MKLVLEQSAANALANAKQRKTPNHSQGNPHSHSQPPPSPKRTRRRIGVATAAAERRWGERGVTHAKRKRKKSSVERAPPEAGRADSWAAQGRSEVLVGRDPSWSQGKGTAVARSGDWGR